MNRLRVGLALAFTLVVLVAVGAIAVLIIRTTDTQFRQHITNSGMRALGSGSAPSYSYLRAQVPAAIAPMVSGNQHGNPNTELMVTSALLPGTQGPTSDPPARSGPLTAQCALRSIERPPPPR